MSPRAVDLLEDGFPHGTTEGFAAGCRSAGACPAGHDHGLSCRRAQILSAGNYQYQQLVRAGEEPSTIAQLMRLAPEAPTKPTKAPTITEPERRPVVAPTPAPTPAAPKPKWAVRHAWVAFDPDGTMYGPFDGQPAAIDFVGEHLRKPEPPAATSPRTRKPWTDEDTKMLRELNALGFSDNEVGRRLGRSQGLVSAYRRRLGIESNRDRNRAEQS